MALSILRKASWGVLLKLFLLPLALAGQLDIQTFKVVTPDGVPLTVVRYLCPGVPLRNPMVRLEGTGATTWLGQNPMKDICQKEGAAYLVHPRGQGAGQHLNMTPEDVGRAPDSIQPTRGRAKYGMWNMPEDFDQVVRFAQEDLATLGCASCRIDVSGHSLGAWVVTQWSGGLELGADGVARVSAETSRQRLSRVRAVVPMGVWEPAEFSLHYRVLAAAAGPLETYFRSHDLQLPYDVGQDPMEFEAIQRETRKALDRQGVFARLPHMSGKMKDELVGHLARIFVRNGIIDMSEYSSQEVLEIARKGGSGQIRGPLIAEYISMIRKPAEMSALTRQSVHNIGSQDVSLLLVASEADTLTPASHARVLERIAREAGVARTDLLTMTDQSHVGMVYTEKSWRQIHDRLETLVQAPRAASTAATRQCLSERLGALFRPW
jgi:hypothetical protein